MSGWRDLIRSGKFEEAEALVQAEVAEPDPYGEDMITQGEFYEAWGDYLGKGPEAVARYRQSHYFWAVFASWATSGGEGTARMRDANRVLEKIAALEKQT
jgi:hypothetical protein